MADSKTIRLKVEGFDAEGQAVPLDGPVLVLVETKGLPDRAVTDLIGFHERLPKGSLILVGPDAISATPFDKIPDEVLVAEAQRRWVRGTGLPNAMLGKELRDVYGHIARAAAALGIEVKPESLMADIAARVADYLEGAAICHTDDRFTPEEEPLVEVFDALDMALDHPPDIAIIRGWSPEERAEAKAWALAFYDWSHTSGVPDVEPKQPECLKRALDFLANGMLKLGRA